MRIITYSQLIGSCRSLAMESLSAAFGASVDFVGTHVHPFSITALL
jgi:26S proteasome regulatory subunit N7